ncbi:flagellar protein FlaG [Lederbergia sp. NSJ-179]|uniref:flagellar protein FlaG n=1 Tax=Lederbergia sp. NSJ-179 TaxID=2931402 RepID=UPI001FD25BCD|nr:flagellar protein FlaG [Lederbergia sp. NSJ-179]MCJ7840172.1 flagellar protein FlaG [Lederbergia sp. NSJ-179]
MSGQIGTGLSAASNGMMAGKMEEIQMPNGKMLEKVRPENNPTTVDTPFTKADVSKVLNGMNQFLKASTQTHLKFEFHDQLNEYYVTLVDETTNEVVREIPPKKILDMFAAMTEYLGLMVDKKI